jgi:hypothetical protein
MRVTHLSSDKYEQKWVAALFRKDPWAVTLFGTTYYTVPKSLVSDSWRRHEDQHKAQQSAEGWKFYPRYLWQTLTKGYDRNRYEVDARGKE